MADTSKFKNRPNRLGSPPPPSEASGNLDAPEAAPAAMPEASPRATRSAPQRRERVHSHDGRSARRTGRTVQFATRVSEAFDERVRTIAKDKGLLLVEVLELALDAYETAERGRAGAKD